MARVDSDLFFRGLILLFGYGDNAFDDDNGCNCGVVGEFDVLLL